MKLQLIDLGKDGSKWKHDYIPLNAAAVALKAHRKPGGSGGVGGDSPAEIRRKISAGEAKDIANTAAAYGVGSPQHKAKIAEIARRGEAKRAAPARFKAVPRVNHLSTGPEKVRNVYHVKDTQEGYLDHHVNQDKIFQGTKKEALAHAAFRNEQHAKGIAPTQAERRAGEERSMAKMDAERAAAGRRSLENSAKIMQNAYAVKASGTTPNYKKPEGRAGDVVSRSGETRSAYSHLSSFQPGHKAIVTDEQGRQHLTTVNRSGRGDGGGFGSFESHSVGASLGPGRYTYNINNANLSNGKLNIRHATAEEIKNGGVRIEKVAPAKPTDEVGRPYVDPIIAARGGTMGATADGLAKMGLGKSPEAARVRAAERAKVTANGVTGSVGNMTDVSALRAAAKATKTKYYTRQSKSTKFSPVSG